MYIQRRCMIKYRYGDVFGHIDELDVVVHGLNCICAWGTGFAKEARVYMPNTHIIDMGTKRGDIKKLGQLIHAKEDGFIGAGIYTQFLPGKTQPKQMLNALDEGLQQLVSEFKGLRIGMPKIGSGLAKNDWSDIEHIIIGNLLFEDTTIFLI